LLSWFESLVDPYPITPVGEATPKRFFAFLWYCARGMRRYVAAMAFLTALIGAYEALLFSMLGHIVDWLAQVEPSRLFIEKRTELIVLAAILLLSPIVIALQTLVKHQTLASNFPMRLRWRFHSAMLDQSMSFYQDEFAGRVATKVMQTALAVRDTWFVLSDILIYVGIYFITISIVAASFDIWLLLPFICWVGLYTIAMRYFVPRLSRVARNQADARSLMTGRITDAYTNISTVKLFSHGKREASYARDAMQDFMRSARGQMRLVTGFEIINHLLSVLLIGSTAGLSLWLWSRGQLGVGAVAAATAMALRLNGISQWVMWEFASLFEYIGTVQDGINTLGRPKTVTDVSNATHLEVTHGDVRFEDVTFAYGNKTPVIEHFNLHIRPGEKIGLVGRSGAGKSTIVNLLLRFYDIEHGQILIDGHNIAAASQESLRSQIGMVTQDTSLLHRSVRDNIKYGKPDASDEDMQRAARLAEADQFIEHLADAAGRTAYEAHVGERGVKLSGGQRQRIAIARVMLKDAPILLLDEATSALDSEVESAIQGSLGRLMEGKTVVAIAHRLSTIAAMDRLIVLDRGRIVEEGDHHTLLQQDGLYARLWAHQSGGFLIEDDEDIVLDDGSLAMSLD
jgi:ATP-binding cassette subfamily B multidrug efflux pump